MKIGESNYIQQLKKHNEKALLYVIDAYGGLLMAIVKKHLCCLPDMQEECFNDVLLNIWQHIDSFDGRKTTFKNWAAAVARYRAIDYLRKYRRDPQPVSIEDVALYSEDRILAGLAESELSNSMEKLLSCLKPADRELFLKLYVEEKDIGQVSRETGLKKDVIYNRLSRGKRKLRRQFVQGRGV